MVIIYSKDNLFYAWKTMRERIVQLDFQDMKKMFQSLFEFTNYGSGDTLFQTK